VIRKKSRLCSREQFCVGYGGFMKKSKQFLLATTSCLPFVFFVATTTSFAACDAGGRCVIDDGSTVSLGQNNPRTKFISTSGNPALSVTNGSTFKGKNIDIETQILKSQYAAFIGSGSSFEVDGVIIKPADGKGLLVEDTQGGFARLGGSGLRIESNDTALTLGRGALANFEYFTADVTGNNAAGIHITANSEARPLNLRGVNITTRGYNSHGVQADSGTSHIEHTVNFIVVNGAHSYALWSSNLGGGSTPSVIETHNLMLRAHGDENAKFEDRGAALRASNGGRIESVGGANISADKNSSGAAVDSGSTIILGKGGVSPLEERNVIGTRGKNSFGIEFSDEAGKTSDTNRNNVTLDGNLAYGMKVYAEDSFGIAAFGGYNVINVLNNANTVYSL